MTVAGDLYKLRNLSNDHAARIKFQLNFYYSFQERIIETK